MGIIEYLPEGFQLTLLAAGVIIVCNAVGFVLTLLGVEFKRAEHSNEQYDVLHGGDE